MTDTATPETVLTEAPDTSDRDIKWGARAGDLIHHRDTTEVYKVIRVKSAKNFLCLGEDGKNWNIPRATARFAAAGTLFAEEPRAAAEVGKGSIVRFSNPQKETGKIFAVTGWDEARKTAQLFEVNALSSRYYRGVPATALEVVEVAPA